MSTETVTVANDAHCKNCGDQKQWIDCYNCGGEGYSHHDCGEDCCCCLEPEDNVVCDICRGEGGYRLCPSCHPASFDDC